MPDPKREWNGDRLLVGCIVVLSVAYGGWLVALRVWPTQDEASARQSFHGFMPGSSQPSFGGAEASPAEAGEYATSRLGTSYYWGGASPRPIAEGARAVLGPEPSPGTSRRGPATPLGPSPSPSGSESRELGRLELGPRIGAWVTRRYGESISQSLSQGISQGIRAPEHRARRPAPRGAALQTGSEGPS